VGGGGGAPLGIVGATVLLIEGGSELVGDGDFNDGRLIEELLKLCAGLLLRVGGGGALLLKLPLLGPLIRFPPKLGGPGGGSFLKFGLLPPMWGPGLLPLGGPPRLLAGGPLFCDGSLKPVASQDMCIIPLSIPSEDTTIRGLKKR
jgi:hypothetical protein